MAQQIINNGESGLVVRGKINSNFTEVYGFTETPEALVQLTDVDFSSGEYIIQEADYNKLFVIDLTASATDKTIKIPNASVTNVAKRVSINYLIGSVGLNVTTVGGAQNIGDSTTQTFVKSNEAITLTANTSNWLIRQDSRINQASVDVISWNDGVDDVLTLEDEIRHFFSATKLEGGEITKGVLSIDVASSQWYVRNFANDDAQLKPIFVPAMSGLSLTDNDTQYLIVNYNDGNPIYQIVSDITVIPCQDRCVDSIISVVNGDIDIVEVGDYGVDFRGKYFKAESVRNYFAYGSGIQISETGIRNVIVSSGSLYIGNIRYNTPSIDTSAGGSFTYYYRNGVGGWTEQVSSTQISSTQYDDGSGTLQSTSPNKFYVHAVYVRNNNPSDFSVLYPQAVYNSLAEAQANAGVPQNVPAFGDAFSTGRFIGSIITKSNTDAFQDILSPFTESLASVTPTNHNNLAGLQLSADTVTYGHIDDQAQTIYGEKTFIDGVHAPNIGAVGTIVKPSVSYDGVSDITIGAGTYRLNENADFSGNNHEVEITGDTVITLTLGQTTYICADYNGGTPQIVAKTAREEAVLGDTWVIYTVVALSDGTVSVIDWDEPASGGTNKLVDRLIDSQRFQRVSGLGITTNTSLNATIASGIAWQGTYRNLLSQVNSATDECYLRINTGDTTWSRDAVTTFPNTQYDNKSGTLQPLTVGNYAVIWLFRSMSSSSKMHLVMGNGDYTLNEAVASDIPVVPESLSSNTLLVGRIIIQNGSTTPERIDSAFEVLFAPSITSVHNTLVNIQGGDVGEGEYYHLSKNNFDLIDDWNPRIEKIVALNEPLPTTVGWYIFTGTPIGGLPVGLTLNDIVYFDGASTWETYLPYEKAPSSISVGTSDAVAVIYNRKEGTWKLPSGIANANTISTSSATPLNVFSVNYVDTTSAIVELVLPTTSVASGQYIDFIDKELTWNTNSVSLTAEDGGNIDGVAPPFLLNIASTTVRALYNGSEWEINLLGTGDSETQQYTISNTLKKVSDGLFETAVVDTEYYSPNQHGGIHGVVYRQYKNVGSLSVGSLTNVSISGLGSTSKAIELMGYCKYQGTDIYLPIGGLAETNDTYSVYYRIWYTSGYVELQTNAVGIDNGYFYIDYTK